MHTAVAAALLCLDPHGSWDKREGHMVRQEPRVIQGSGFSRDPRISQLTLPSKGPTSQPRHTDKQASCTDSDHSQLGSCG